MSVFLGCSLSGTACAKHAWPCIKTVVYAKYTMLTFCKIFNSYGVTLEKIVQVQNKKNISLYHLKNVCYYKCKVGKGIHKPSNYSFSLLLSF